MSKVEIFEPAVSGIGIDPDRLRLLAFIDVLASEGKKITCYNFAKQPQEFANNKYVNEAINNAGNQIFPITVVDGEIKQVESYPSNADLATWSGMTREELISMIIKARDADGGGGGCCGGGKSGCC